MTNTLSISWAFPSALSLVEAARALEPHFRAWFGHESDLTGVHYSLFTDTKESFQNQADYAPLLQIIDGQPQFLILHLTGQNREAGITAVDIWLHRHTSTHPINVTVKITGAEIATVATLRDRSRQRLAGTVEEVLGVTPEVGPDAGSLTGGGALSASPQVTASIFDQVDQSQRIGSPRPARVFLSYSHDSEEHRQWVARLANRLNSLGIWLIFDQWDLELGGDLPRFMESGITEADRVIIVCTEQYNRKANGGHGGAGYEKMIMTADLMRDQTSSRLVPVVRGSQSPSTPTFLRSRLYVDFTDDALFETRLGELSRALLATGSQRPPYSPPASAGL